MPDRACRYEQDDLARQSFQATRAAKKSLRLLVPTLSLALHAGHRSFSFGSSVDVNECEPVQRSSASIPARQWR